MEIGSKIILAGETNRGMIRHRNEDSFCLSYRDGDNASLAVIADGIGGQRDGDIASFVCCRRLLAAWKKRELHNLSEPGAVAFLKNEIDWVNTTLHQQNRFDRISGSMGTTVVCVIFLPERVVVGHAGDSRAYMYKNGCGLLQLTEDHTLQRKIEEDGGASGKLKFITPENLANIISRAVGPRRRLELEIQSFDRSADARFLLCSDGLCRYVQAERLTALMAGTRTAHEAVDRLMREALLAGAPDNVSIVCGFPVG